MRPMNGRASRSACEDDTTRSGAGGGSIVAVLSGKGGVGKTNVTVNLGIAASRLGARVLIVDGDLGLANIDVMLGLVPRFTAADVHAGRCTWEDAIVDGPGGVRILPAASARADLAAASPRDLDWLLAYLIEARRSHDLVLVDIGSGIGLPVLSLASVSQLALLVTTPEPTSITDAYATLKVLSGTLPELAVELVVNVARDEAQARNAHARLQELAHRFLDRSLALRGTLERDPRVEDAIAQQMPVVEAFPTARASRRLVGLAQDVLRDSAVSNPTDRVMRSPDLIGRSIGS